MKLSVSTLVLISLFSFSSFSQRRTAPRSSKPKPAAVKKATNEAVIIDQRLAVLRSSPSLYAKPIQRMSGGRRIAIGESKNADGVTFYRVNMSSKTSGWVQADAIASVSRAGDDERLAKLVQGSQGFERIERASIFIEMFPKSSFRPSILLLFGDLVETESEKLSGRATRSLDRREMAASGAPLHSFYLNYPFLDRFRKLGIVFLFNSNTRNYHYDGETWKEIVRKYPESREAVEAQKRLNSLREKLERIK